MLRTIFQELLLVLLPTILYGIYFIAMRERARSGGKPQPEWERGNLFWLILSGCVLAIIGLVIVGSTGNKPPDTDYVPPHIEGGKVVPGRTR
jgi:hypothetical protein